ncbi:unnamed protein product [Closterium sp. Naga37s-1]|nr:unnamed protein product [Closterium sp. Naga37s-1]
MLLKQRLRARGPTPLLTDVLHMWGVCVGDTTAGVAMCACASISICAPSLFSLPLTLEIRHVDASLHRRPALLQLSVNVCGPQVLTLPLETTRNFASALPPFSLPLTPPYQARGPLSILTCCAPTAGASTCAGASAGCSWIRARWCMVEQGAGDAIFVPSNWLHQVTNLEDTISINHNWINATNLMHTWRLLKEDEQEARAAICDVEEMVKAGQMTEREFQQLVQRNLMANSGMNYTSFLSFCSFFAVRAMRTALQEAWRSEKDDLVIDAPEARVKELEARWTQSMGSSEDKEGGLTEELGRGLRSRRGGSGGGVQQGALQGGVRGGVQGGLPVLLQAKYDLYEIATVLDDMVLTKWYQQGLWRRDGEGGVEGKGVETGEEEEEKGGGEEKAEGEEQGAIGEEKAELGPFRLAMLCRIVGEPFEGGDNLFFRWS